MATDWDAMSGGERSLRAVNPAMASALYDPESMVSFKKRVDKLLTNLRESPAGPKQVEAEAASRDHFGGGRNGWAEAAGLSGAYDTVIEQLTKLSQLLADSMEGMGIAVVASKDGFEAMDDDIRRRMVAISKRTEKEYDFEKDPVAQQLARERAQEEARRNQEQPGAEGRQGDTAGAGGMQ
ncbi:hypothetical protein [Streptomyces formicae]|uniref:WXG100 family type VII secretion target n=1 Tax=Streptomyces formicae TaxID=1616117 RepID=A0ABY3WV36_9ACTN|nr:hypothetical protein [Streptomyces formicae]UNM15416.1 hypothetical protein J4032_31680 [Streptomyces formicae]